MALKANGRFKSVSHAVRRLYMENKVNKVITLVQEQEEGEASKSRVTSLFNFEFEGLLAALRRDHTREEEASHTDELLRRTSHAKNARLDIELLELLNPKAMTMAVPVVLSVSAA